MNDNEFIVMASKAIEASNYLELHDGEIDRLIALACRGAALEAAEAYAAVDGDALETVDYVGRIAALENIDRQRREQISRLQDTIEKYQNKTSETAQPVIADGWKYATKILRDYVYLQDYGGTIETAAPERLADYEKHAEFIISKMFPAPASERGDAK